MLAANHGQNSPLGVPFRSDSAMTSSPWRSTARTSGGFVAAVLMR